MRSSIANEIKKFALNTKPGNMEQKLEKFVENYIKLSLKDTRFKDEIPMYELSVGENGQKEIRFLGPEPIVLNFSPVKVNERNFNEIKIERIEKANDGTFAEIEENEIPIGRYKVTSEVLNDINVALHSYYKNRNAEEYFISVNTENIAQALEYSKMKIFSESEYSAITFEDKENFEIAEDSKLANLQTTYQMLYAFPDLPREVKMELIRENKKMYNRMIAENFENKFGNLQIEVNGKVESIDYIDLIVAQRPEIIEEYPALAYEYDKDGIRKEFDEILETRDEEYIRRAVNKKDKEENKEQLKSEISKSFSRILYSNLMANHSKEDIENIIDVIGVDRFEEELKNIDNDLKLKVRDQELVEKEAIKYFEENRDIIEKGLTSDEINEVEEYFALVNGQVAITNLEGREAIEKQENEKQQLLDEIMGYVAQIKGQEKEPLSEEEIEKAKKERKGLKLIGITGLVGGLVKKIHDKIKEENENDDPEQEIEEDEEDKTIKKKDEKEKNIEEEDEPIYEEDEEEKEVDNEEDKTTKKKDEKEKNIEEEDEPIYEEDEEEKEVDDEEDKTTKKKDEKEKNIEEEDEPIYEEDEEDKEIDNEEDKKVTVDKEKNEPTEEINEEDENKNSNPEDKNVDDAQTKIEPEEDEPIVVVPTPKDEEIDKDKEKENEKVEDDNKETSKVQDEKENEDLTEVKINVKKVNISVDNSQLKDLKDEKRKVQGELDEVKDVIHNISTKSEETRRYLVSIFEKKKEEVMTRSVKKQIIGDDENLQKEYDEEKDTRVNKLIKSKEEIIRSGEIDLEDPIIQKSKEDYEDEVKFVKDMADRDQRKKLSEHLQRKKELLKEYFGIRQKIDDIEKSGIPQKLSAIEIEISEKAKNSPKKPGEDDGFEI